MVGLLLYATGVATFFKAVEFPESGGVDFNPAGLLAAVCAVASYCAPRRLRWVGFLLTLLWAAGWGKGSFLIGSAVSLCGLALREIGERSARSEGGDPRGGAEPDGDPIVERRRMLERRGMRRRQVLLTLMISALILPPCSLGGCYLYEQRKEEVRRMRQRAREEEFERLPGTPEFLVVLHRTPHEGCMTYAEFVRDYDSPESLDYDRRSFRVVGKATQLRQGVTRYAELKMRDRDDRATFDTVYFRFHALANFNNVPLEPPITIGESDGDLVVVDGILEDPITFGHCVVRWHGKGDDWGTAVREAKKGLDFSKVNRKRAPGG